MEVAALATRARHDGCLDGYGNAGMGVVNRVEDDLLSADDDCRIGSPQNAVDNLVNVDGIFLSFSQDVMLTGVGLGSIENDSDFSVLFYNGDRLPSAPPTRLQRAHPQPAPVERVVGAADGDRRFPGQ